MALSLGSFRIDRRPSGDESDVRCWTVQIETNSGSSLCCHLYVRTHTRDDDNLVHELFMEDAKSGVRFEF
jgi:hypothetical protein